MEERFTGKVKFFNTTKGYGFLIDELDETKEYFFHITGLTDTGIRKDDQVEFTLANSPKGVKAVNIRKLS